MHGSTMTQSVKYSKCLTQNKSKQKCLCLHKGKRKCLPLYKGKWKCLPLSKIFDFKKEGLCLGEMFGFITKCLALDTNV